MNEFSQLDHITQPFKEVVLFKKQNLGMINITEGFKKSLNKPRSCYS